MNTELVQALDRVRQMGAALLKPLQIDHTTLQMKTEEAAKTAGVLAAVRAFEAAVGPLCAPGKSPTLADGRHALDTLQHQRATQAAYRSAYEQVLVMLCDRLEEELDRQQEREV